LDTWKTDYIATANANPTEKVKLAPIPSKQDTVGCIAKQGIRQGSSVCQYVVEVKPIDFKSPTKGTYTVALKHRVPMKLKGGKSKYIWEKCETHNGFATGPCLVYKDKPSLGYFVQEANVDEEVNALLHRVKDFTMVCYGEKRHFVLMEYRATRNIAKGAEVLCDYGHDGDDEFVRENYSSKYYTCDYPV
jgi:hypothetical protein